MTAEFTNGAYEPGTYTKGDVTRVAKSASEAVDLVWKGFVRQAEKSEEPSNEVEGGEKANEPGDPGPTTLDLAESDAPEPKRGPGRPRKTTGGDQ